MKEKNLDFVVDECRHILRVACANNDIDPDKVDDIICNFNMVIQDEYKYLLRGPR